MQNHVISKKKESQNEVSSDMFVDVLNSTQPEIGRKTRLQSASYLTTENTAPSSNFHRLKTLASCQ